MKCSKVSRHCSSGTTALRNLDTQSAQVSVHERCMEGDDVVELTAEGKARRGTTWQRPQLRDSVFWQAADSSELRKNATRWRVVCRGCVLHKKIAGALAVSKDVSAGEGTLPVALRSGFISCNGSSHTHIRINHGTSVVGWWRFSWARSHR